MDRIKEVSVPQHLSTTLAYTLLPTRPRNTRARHLNRLHSYYTPRIRTPPFLKLAADSHRQHFLVTARDTVPRNIKDGFSSR